MPKEDTQFKEGNKAAVGSKGGRSDPNWLKNKCKELTDRSELVDFLAKVAKGDKVDTHVTIAGQVIDVPASTKDRLKAVEMLIDRGWGKPKQEADLKVSDNRVSWDELMAGVERRKAARNNGGNNGDQGSEHGEDRPGE